MSRENQIYEISMQKFIAERNAAKILPCSKVLNVYDRLNINGYEMMRTKKCT